MAQRYNLRKVLKLFLIDGHWENVGTLKDISRIIREYYNRELADKLDELVDDLIEAYNYRIEELEDAINSIDDDWYDD